MIIPVFKNQNLTNFNKLHFTTLPASLKPHKLAGGTAPIATTRVSFDRISQIVQCNIKIFI